MRGFGSWRAEWMSIEAPVFSLQARHRKATTAQAGARTYAASPRLLVTQVTETRPPRAITIHPRIFPEPNMSKSFVEITTDLSKAMEKLRAEVPEAMAGFSALAKASMKSGALSELQKELIALGIGVAARCDGCIGFHVKALIRLGVTREQVMETLAVAVYMGGGPSLMHAAEALSAYEEFVARLRPAQPAIA